MLAFGAADVQAAPKCEGETYWVPGKGCLAYRHSKFDGKPLLERSAKNPNVPTKTKPKNN